MLEDSLLGHIGIPSLREYITLAGIENAAHRFYSLYRGTIVDTHDPEARGRVKVRVEMLSSETVNYAEVVSPYAGNGFGLFLPRLGEPPFTTQLNGGDQVWVAFQFGDPRFPLIVGSRWLNPKKALQTTQLPSEIAEPGNPTTTLVLRSRIGHALVMEDSDALANKRVELRTAKLIVPPNSPPNTAASQLQPLHSLVMSDKLRTIVLASAGEDPAAPGTLQHKLTFDDFLKRITLVSGVGHQLILDDGSTGPRAALSTKRGDLLELTNLPTPKATFSLKSGHKLVMDEAAQTTTLTTPLKRQVVLSDTAQTVQISDPAGNSVLMSPAGITVTSLGTVNIASAGKVETTLGPSVSLTTGPTSPLFIGALAATIVGVLAVSALGGIAITTLAALAVTAASVTFTVSGIYSLVCPDIRLGSNDPAQLRRLVREEALPLIAQHTHIASAGGGPTTTSATLLAAFTAPAAPYVTTTTKAL